MHLFFVNISNKIYATSVVACHFLNNNISLDYYIFIDFYLSSSLAQHALSHCPINLLIFLVCEGKAYLFPHYLTHSSSQKLFITTGPFLETVYHFIYFKEVVYCINQFLNNILHYCYQLVHNFFNYSYYITVTSIVSLSFHIHNNNRNNYTFNFHVVLFPKQRASVVKDFNAYSLEFHQNSHSTTLQC